MNKELCANLFHPLFLLICHCSSCFNLSLIGSLVMAVTKFILFGSPRRLNYKRLDMARNTYNKLSHNQWLLHCRCHYKKILKYLEILKTNFKNLTD